MFIYSGNRPFNIDFIFDYSMPATLALAACQGTRTNRHRRGSQPVAGSRPSLSLATSSPAEGAFDVDNRLYLSSVESQMFTDSEDVSGGALLSSIIEKNKNQLSVFRQLCFRDSETQTLLVQGTEELIRKLEKLKRFLKTKENTKT